jgi:hypothetical protein
MQKPLTAFALVLVGSLLGAGLVYLGRSLERERPLPPAASPDGPQVPMPAVAAAPVAAAAPTRAANAGGRLHDDPPALIARARTAYDQAKNAALKQTGPGVDKLLLLGYVAASDGDRALARYLAEGRKNAAEDPFARLLDPSLPAPHLGELEDRGLLLLNAYLQAAVGEPDDVALHRLALFAARDEQGYALCHQVLALGWYESTGRRLTDELETRRLVLLRKLEDEQRADSTATDLFAERASTLLLYGAPERTETRRWVQALLAAQQSDGTWGMQERTLAFDGQALPATADVAHTVAHGLFVLRRFIDTSAVQP